MPSPLFSVCSHLVLTVPTRWEHASSCVLLCLPTCSHCSHLFYKNSRVIETGKQHGKGERERHVDRKVCGNRWERWEQIGKWLIGKEKKRSRLIRTVGTMGTPSGNSSLLE